MEFISKLEKPLVEIANQIKELKLSETQASTTAKTKITTKIKTLEKQFEEQAKKIFKDLTPYQITQMARHPNRPYTTDIIAGLCKDFIELHGDRLIADDKSIISGIGILHNGTRVAIIGHQKGRNTKENVFRNFGMPHPEGYRKALRIMKLAERFSLPIITLIDTPGAYPGKDAEEHGQSEAIATNILIMSRLSVPVLTVIVGEGGSGGALAIAVADKVLMLQYAIYSVISPEGCASILWKDGSKAEKAASLLGITADIALKNKIVDTIIPEPIGGAHWDRAQTIKSIGAAIDKSLEELCKLSIDELKEKRTQKYFAMGEFVEKPAISPLAQETPIISAWKAAWKDD